MAEAQGGAAEGGAPPAQASILSSITKVILFLYVYNWATGANKPRPTVDSSGKKVVHQNAWKIGDVFDIQVFLSNGIPELDVFDDEDYLDYKSDTPKWEEFTFEDETLFEERSLKYSWEGEQEYETRHVKLPCTPHLQHNGSLWAHTYFFHAGYSPDPTAENYDKRTVEHHFNLVEYRKKSLKKKFKNLLTQSMEDKSDDDEEEEPLEDPIVSYFCPKLSLRLLVDHQSFNLNGIPAPMNEHYIISEEEEIYPDYLPIGYVDSFWVLRDTYLELNDTVSEIDLEISYSPISIFKYQFQVQMSASWDQQQEYGLNEEGDSEEVRRMLLETNPWYLALTMVITIFHMLFDFLAFKNDITFWKNAEDIKGLSVNTIFLNCGCQIVILLYLLDNDTSYMVLLSCGVGVLIEFWKIRRAANVTWGTEGGWLGILPWIKIEDKESYVNSGTSEYDRAAMKYLSYVLYPLIVGYGIYSLIYEEHKGWYAFVLSSLVGTVYTFGFIMQCPQLYLNYKLQSVAHLPWRMLTYKFLNTIIDDLFAFIIKMPTMHRLSCFRDDIVFVIFLYQKWKYRIDYSRVNEFGYKPKLDTEGNEIDNGQPDSDKSDGEKPDTGISEESDAKFDSAQPGISEKSKLGKAE